MTGNNDGHASDNVLKTAAQAAAYLGVSERTIRRYIRAGKLGTLDIGSETRIQQTDLDNLAAVSKTIQARTGKTDRHASDIVQETPDPVAEALRETLKRQDSEISFLRNEITALRTTLDKAMLMLPAASRTPQALPLWVFAVLALIVIAGAVVLLWIR